MKDLDHNFGGADEPKLPTSIVCRKLKVVGGLKYSLLNDEQWPASDRDLTIKANKPEAKHEWWKLLLERIEWSNDNILSDLRFTNIEG